MFGYVSGEFSDNVFRIITVLLVFSSIQGWPRVSGK